MNLMRQTLMEGQGCWACWRPCYEQHAWQPRVVWSCGWFIYYESTIPTSILTKVTAVLLGRCPQHAGTETCASLVGDTIFSCRGDPPLLGCERPDKARAAASPSLKQIQAGHHPQRLHCSWRGHGWDCSMKQEEISTVSTVSIWRPVHGSPGPGVE